MNLRRIKTDRLETLLFAHLMVTAIVAVLAFGTVEPWSLAIFEINALVMAVLLGLLQMLDPRFEWRRLRFALPLWLLLGWALIQVVPFGVGASLTAAPETVPFDQLRLQTISMDPQATREAISKLLALAIYFTVALVVFRRSDRRLLAVRILSIFGLTISFLAIVQRLTWNGQIYWFRKVSIYVAPFGPYGNYNHFAGMVELIFTMPLAMVLFSRIRVEERLFHALSVILLVVAAILSMSRGGMLSIALQFLVCLVVFVRWGRERQERGRAIFLPLAIIATVLIVSLWVGYDSIVRRFDSVQQGAGEYSVVTRVAYLRASWRMFLDHPLTGVGLGAFPTVYPAYGSSSSRYERVEQVHNDYLQLLTDGGIVAGSILLVFAGWVVALSFGVRRRLVGMRRDDRAILIGALLVLPGIGVHSLFDFNLQIAANALLMLIATALALSFFADQDLAG